MKTKINLKPFKQLFFFFISFAFIACENENVDPVQNNDNLPKIIHDTSKYSESQIQAKNSGCTYFEVFELFEVSTTQNGVTTTHIEAQFVDTIVDCSETSDSSGSGNEGGSGTVGGGNGSGNNNDDSSATIDAFPHPHCSSFEYAERNNVRGCAVSGFNETFINRNYHTDGVEEVEILISIPILYFTAPLIMTNGTAATRTAEALENAIDATDDWYDLHENAHPDDVARKFWENLRTEMFNMGGSVNTENYYDFINPAPYVTSIVWSGNCN